MMQSSEEAEALDNHLLCGQVVENCGVIYSMLSTPEAAQAVFYDPTDGVLAGLSEGKGLVDCATLQVAVRKRLDCMLP